VSDPARRLKDILWLFVLVGGVALAFRLWYGLGATTNLSDAVPWGLWKILNMVAGVALATGGFTVSLLVYVLGIQRLRPLVKPAILIAFLGYGSSVFALFLDIGLPYRIWHPLLMWNLHSFLFEVGMCVATYFLVTIVELTPTILERFPRGRGAVKVMHRVTPVVVIVGITLSSLHHTSLGSLFLVTPQRLYPLWYTAWLPWLFITSAMGAGMMVTVLLTMAWARLYEPETVMRPRGSAPGHPAGRANAEPTRLPALRTLATVAAGVLAVFLLLKVVDLFRTGAWPYLLAGTWESWLYLSELALTAVVPVVLMMLPRVRRSAGGIATAAASAALGLVLNRLDVGIFGYFHDAQAVYFPSATEWAVSLGVIAAAGLVLLGVAENFPVFDDRWQERAARRRAFLRGFDTLSGVWSAALGDRLARVSLIAVLAVPLAWGFCYPPYRSAARRVIRPPIGTDLQRAVLRIEGTRAAFAVSFPHLDHIKRLGGDASCPRCHHLSLPRDNATPCYRCHRALNAETDLFDHIAHFAAVAAKEKLAGPQAANRSCPLCHRAGQPESAREVKPCLECHREDMKPSTAFEKPKDLHRAPSYRLAFHSRTLCIACHQREAVQKQRPALAECSHCHRHAYGIREAGHVTARRE
jgi:Ni/Fe-hydrogenase subunit HybB-like protein